MVGLAGLEPATPSLSGTYSNQLSYRPKFLRNILFIKTLEYLSTLMYESEQAALAKPRL